MPWDISPSVEQEPAHNPSYGFGEVAPGTLLHSGEFSHDVVDLTMPGLGIPCIMARTYRNQTVGEGPLGPGWDHGYRRRLRPLPNGDIDYFDGRGRRQTFEASDPLGLETKVSFFGLKFTISDEQEERIGRWAGFFAEGYDTATGFFQAVQQNQSPAETMLKRGISETRHGYAQFSRIDNALSAGSDEALLEWEAVVSEEYSRFLEEVKGLPFGPNSRCCS